MKEVNTARRTYEAPKLTRHGSFSDLTLGLQAGNHLDETFPVNTDRALLTFS